MKASSCSVLLLLVTGYGSAAADPATPTRTEQVEPGIRYLYYGDAETPMHAVVLDRSHREYEFRVLAEEVDGHFVGQRVDHFATTHIPQAIAAINGGLWRCDADPESPACNGFRPGAEYLPTGALVTNWDVFADPKDGEVIFGAAMATRPGSRIALTDAANYFAQANQPFQYYALGLNVLNFASGKRSQWVLKDGACQAPLNRLDARSAIGFGRDSIVLLSSEHDLVSITRRKADIPDLCWFFRLHGVTDAILLDGSYSAQMYVKGVGAPVNPIFGFQHVRQRLVANAIGIVKVCDVAGQACAPSGECCDGLRCVGGRCGAGNLCGNGMIDGDEVCDQGDLGGTTCADLGFDGGGVSCTAACQINDNACCIDACPRNTFRCGAGVEEKCVAAPGACAAWTATRNCPNGCSGNMCAAGCACSDGDGDGHFVPACGDATCGPRDDCNDMAASIYGSAPELCDLVDNDCDNVIDDNASCWRPVYRFWNMSAPDPTTPRCYANTAAVPAGCPGYTLEFPGPAYFVQNQAAPGTVEFLVFDKLGGSDHLLVRAGTQEAINLSAANSGWNLRGSMGYYWPNAAPPPAGTYYMPPGALTSSVRDLRRYYHVAANIHLFTNSPTEMAPGWNNEGVRAYVWSSRW